jgi:UDP-glucuronate 4-epimerase
VITTLERLLGVTAEKEMLPLQPGDVLATCADVADLARDVGFRPSTPITTGIERFVRWYCDVWRPMLQNQEGEAAA